MDIYALRVCLTNDEELQDYPQAFRAPSDVVKYLNESPRHAIVIVDADTSVNNESLGPVYVLRGASGEPDNFYWGFYPAEDPNDANGGDLTAEEAIRQAVAEIKGVTL